MRMGVVDAEMAVPSAGPTIRNPSVKHALSITIHWVCRISISNSGPLDFIFSVVPSNKK